MGAPVPPDDRTEAATSNDTFKPAAARWRWTTCRISNVGGAGATSALDGAGLLIAFAGAAGFFGAAFLQGVNAAAKKRADLLRRRLLHASSFHRPPAEPA